jgi:hypothetical protein
MIMPKMKAPKNCGGFSAGGEQYKIDKQGFAKIKPQHVDSALRHGFEHVDGEGPDEAEQEQPAEQEKGPDEAEQK